MAARERFVAGPMGVKYLEGDEAELLELLNPQERERKIFRDPAATFIEREDGEGYDVRQGGYTNYGERLSTGSAVEKQPVLPPGAKRRIGVYPRT